MLSCFLDNLKRQQIIPLVDKLQQAFAIFHNTFQYEIEIKESESFFSCQKFIYQNEKCSSKKKKKRKHTWFVSFFFSGESFLVSQCSSSLNEFSCSFEKKLFLPSLANAFNFTCCLFSTFYGVLFSFVYRSRYFFIFRHLLGCLYMKNTTSTTEKKSTYTMADKS